MMDIAKLIERVEAATGPDRVLDADLFRMATRRWNGAVGYAEVDPYTASIDAALGLVDRLLGVDDPALCYSYDLGWHCSAHASMAYTADLHLAVGDPAKMETVHGQAHTQPLAILAALLRALSARSP